jgi:hypothetical protein
MRRHPQKLISKATRNLSEICSKYHPPPLLRCSPAHQHQSAQPLRFGTPPLPERSATSTRCRDTRTPCRDTDSVFRTRSAVFPFRLIDICEVVAAARPAGPPRSLSNTTAPVTAVRPSSACAQPCTPSRLCIMRSLRPLRVVNSIMPSSARLYRIKVHFEGDAGERIIVIGHCGPHPDQK